MSVRKLPVLEFGSFRKYPTKGDQQTFTDDRQVCHQCVSGSCCLNEDAIALTSFDIFRLSAFFNMSPAEFMLTFTQDKFEGESNEWRREWNKDPDSSIVTWLRRRTNHPRSPCLFLKYMRDPDGTPRRICSVHDGRPLSCREYYFRHCKTRGTGELASLLAEGYEKVRDGEITETMVDEQLARFPDFNYKTATLAEGMQFNFWTEMKCVINMDAANIEGARSYNLADYQDPIDEKLNRILSAKYLRSEESYGMKPHDEQLMPYTSGLGFAGSPEWERVVQIARTPPSTSLFQPGHYPHYVGARTMVAGVQAAGVFSTIPDAEINAFLNRLPLVQLFPQHDLADVRSITLRDVYAAVLKAYNYLIRFASHIVALAPILELDPPGTIERELFSMLVGFETSLNPYIAHNPYLQPVKHHLAKVTIDLLEEELKRGNSPAEAFNCLWSLYPVQAARSSLSADLRARAEAIESAVQSSLQKDNLALYVDTDNPVKTRWLAGKRLGTPSAWSEWISQVLAMRFAADAGFAQVDFAAFYRQAVDDLEKLPFRQSYGAYLYDIAPYLAYSMSSYNRIAYQDMPYQDAADRLARYGVRLFHWMEQKTEANQSAETIAGLLAAVYKGLGLSYNHDRSFGLIVYRLLEQQLPDGSWDTNPLPADKPKSQGAFWELMYRTTGACIDGLRPMQHDALNNDNAALGLT